MKNGWMLVSLWLLVLQGCTTMGSAWHTAEDIKGKSRYIPLELWTGQAYEGGFNARIAPAEFTFGSKGRKSIKGPRAWRHPISGQVLQVYERTNETKNGTKQQLYTLNPMGTGLARVYDRRPGQETRYFSDNAVLFPLGWWDKGEERYFRFEEYVDGKKEQRKATIRMRRLSYTYKGVRHAMKFDLMIKDANGELLFYERFIYGPGKSLMYFKNRMAK